LQALDAFQGASAQLLQGVHVWDGRG
jgi:hypothetical protein